MEHHNEDCYSSDAVELRDSLLHSRASFLASAVGIPPRPYRKWRRRPVAIYFSSLLALSIANFAYIRRADEAVSHTAASGVRADWLMRSWAIKRILQVYALA
jgi:hypothetical protein